MPAPEKKEESKGGFLSGLKNWFTGGPAGAQKSPWRWPAIIGGVTALAISAPVGLGVAAGLWSVSKSTNSGLSLGKSVGLQAIGAGTGAACTAVGAAIGSAIFPVVGTLFGAVVGAALGVVAAKLAVAKAKQTKFFTPAQSSAGSPSTHAGKPSAHSMSHVSPDHTPAKTSASSRDGQGRNS